MLSRPRSLLGWTHSHMPSRILLVVVDFASHRTWAEGYVKATQQHDVQIYHVPSERWKWRLQSGAAAELDGLLAQLQQSTSNSRNNKKDTPDVIVVDGMLDVTLLAAQLGRLSTPNHHHRPRLLVYLHENQLTTPWAPKDRDQRNKTHWHYGMAHWRSLLAADGFVFNSRQHFRVFRQALPRLIQQQCPRDTVDWHLQQAQQLLQTKCTVLRYGLALDELRASGVPGTVQSPPPSTTTTTTTPKMPVVLWNARLEADKDPETFFDHVLPQLCQHHADILPIGLIVLGTDPSQGQQWYHRLRQEYGANNHSHTNHRPDIELLYLGWCSQRQDYAHWLQQADVVVSTARHETFGIAVVESVYAGGALPLLPHRLSYPEILGVEENENDSDESKGGFDTDNYLYRSTSDCVHKLATLLRLKRDEPDRFQATVAHMRQRMAQFRWAVMGPVYDNFFAAVATGDDLVAAGERAADMAKDLAQQERLTEHAHDTLGRDRKADDDDVLSPPPIIISEEEDARVALFRPKSLRNHKVYHQQLYNVQHDGVEPVLHGGRRAMVRMLEAISTGGARIGVVSFLTTPQLAKSILEAKMKEAKVDAPLYTAEKPLLDKIRGQKLNAGDAILAMVRFPIVSPLEELIANPPILILEDVRNAENIGSILRTAFCIGIKSVVASNTTWAAITDSRSARCSMGTMYYHKFYKADDASLERCITDIQAAGIRVYGIEIGPEARPITPHGKDRQWSAVMGNEDLGLTTGVRNVCNEIVFIPQAHGDSLNVGHAAAISLYELGREAPVLQHDGTAACT